MLFSSDRRGGDGLQDDVHDGLRRGNQRRMIDEVLAKCSRPSRSAMNAASLD